MMSRGSLITERLRGLRVRKFAKRAGLVVLALVALDLAAGAAAAFVLGAELLRR